MSAHTPGPWRDTGWLQIATETMLPGDTVLAVVHEDEKRGRLRSEAEANARLIAAAPELLEVCKAVLPLLEDWHEDDGRASTMWRKAQNAIAKAEGGE
jgi:hypothetical protein